MKSDVEIAQEAKMRPIEEIAAKIGLAPEELELYGRYKAKVALDAWQRVKERPDGKLILCTADWPMHSRAAVTRRRRRSGSRRWGRASA